MWVRRVCLAGLLGLIWLSAGAAQLVDLDRKDLGIDWSASVSELAVRFPGLKPNGPRSQVYRGPLELDSVSYAERVVEFGFDQDGHLSSLFLGLAGADPSQVASVLDRRLGLGRWVSYPEAGMHVHAYEWNVGPHAVQLMYTASSAERSSKPLAEHFGHLRIDATRPFRTLVDLGLERPKLASSPAVATTPTAASPQLLDLGSKDLGIDWSASAADLAISFPGLKPAALRNHAYRGPLQLGTLSFADEVVLFDFDQAGHLKSLYMGLQGADAIQVIDVLSRQLGQGRWGSYPVARVHVHAYDWNVGPHTIELMYVGSTSQRLSPPAKSVSGHLRITAERPARTLVDDAIDYPKTVEAMRTLMAAGQEKYEEAQRKKQAEQMRAAESAPSPPTVVNATGAAPLRKANTTWGAALNPSGQASVGVFKVFYINTNNPRTAVASDYVTDIAISYDYDQLHKIPSEDFGAYWVGKLRFEKAQDKTVNVSHGVGKSRVIVDGRVIHEGSQAASVPYHFDAGDHVLEVEYVNNWHTTQFKLSVADQLLRLNTAQVRGELRRAGAEGAQVHYIGVYSSKRPDLSIVVSAAQLRGDAVLVLDSHAPVKWIVEDVRHARIKAAVASSFEPGSEVVGLPNVTRILAHAGRVGSYESPQARCRCVASHYFCEDAGDLVKTQTEVAELTGGVLASVTGAYEGETFSLPGTPVTADFIESTKASKRRTEDELQRCEKAANPDFEQLMEKR
jgi:hypothetical protein